MGAEISGSARGIGAVDQEPLKEPLKELLWQEHEDIAQLCAESNGMERSLLEITETLPEVIDLT